MSNIAVLKQKEQPTLFIRTRTSVDQLPQLIGESYCKMSAYLEELNEHLADVPFVAYHNMDMQNLDVEIGFPVAEPIPGKDDIEAGSIPAGLIVFSMNRGPYDKMKPLYKEMANWIEKNGYTATGSAYEYYYNDTSFLETELLTKVVMPVKKDN
ncbi:transcriptional regulator [Acetobacterium bakii]|uniref:Transcriptional regulator n=2 Tax=Acetobacterium bakii TaxID=52689 RepID=A0A0L6U1E5_9FIRM|nr:transcriptional regulator [Acetobacterium bakii]